MFAGFKKVDISSEEWLRAKNEFFPLFGLRPDKPVQDLTVQEFKKMIENS